MDGFGARLRFKAEVVRLKQEADMDAEVIVRISHNIFVLFTLDSSDDWDSTSFDGLRGRAKWQGVVSR